MRIKTMAGAVVLLVASALSARAGVEVRATAGRVDVVALHAPLSVVLERLSEQTGMKVVYEGPPPSGRVTASLLGRSPAEAVNELLRDRGLNYALAVEASGRVSTLIVVTTPPPAAAKEGGRPSPEGLAPLVDMLKRAGLPADEASSASGSKAEDVLPPELAEPLAAAAAAGGKAEIPEGSPLRILLTPSVPPRK